jgi:parvulin-like peptidyl-prolyl isomerase
MEFFQQVSRWRGSNYILVRIFLILPVWLVLVNGVSFLGTGKAWGEESEVVARVNGDPMSRADLQRLLADPLTISRLQQEPGKDPEAKELEHLAVQELIRRRLILQEAERRKFTVTEDELNQTLSTLRRRFGDLESFGVWMHERGLDDKSLFAAIREGMLINRVTATLVEDVHVTEEEVQRYYETHKNNLSPGEKVRLRIIAVKSEDEANEILADLKMGESFSHLARMRSLGKLAARGGDTGWINPRTLPLQLRGVVDMLKEGDVGGPLQKADEEFLLVGLEARRPSQETNLAAMRPQIEQRLLFSKQQGAIQAWLTEQEKQAQIELLLQP